MTKCCGRRPVAAAVALYPPTDILSPRVTSPPDIIEKIDALKPLTFDASKAGVCRRCCTSRKTAPTLLIHGGKDDSLPIEHSSNGRRTAEGSKCRAICWSLRSRPRFQNNQVKRCHGRALVRQTFGEKASEWFDNVGQASSLRCRKGW